MRKEDGREFCCFCMCTLAQEAAELRVGSC